jgi:FtsP/CotA-like multicopper oxidase with cupredoxin domain
MNPPRSLFQSVTLASILGLGWGWESGRQNASAQPLPSGMPSNTIPATVTKAMGDVGGKFFGAVPDPARTRRYYIAIEPEFWDYAPQGIDPVCGLPFPPPLAAKRRAAKLRYVQYTDETFASKVIQPSRLGILGPVLRGVVGDYLAITVLNRVSQPLSLHPHGVKYDKDSEGSYYRPAPGLGAAIGSGARFTYMWHLDEDSGPLPDEPSSKPWLYHSHVTGDGEAGLGLAGFIVVTDPKRANPDGTPKDVDREHAALFMFFDESGLGTAEKEAAEYGLPGKSWTEVQELTEAGARAAINGYVFGNLPGLEMNEGERVRWYTFALGSEEDFHTAHWHGLRVIEDGRRRTDNIELLPASMKVADMKADNPGSWLFHCHVADHMLEGMFARVTVHPKNSPGAGRAPTDRYFGLRQAERSLVIKRASAILDFKPGSLVPAEVRISGSVSVFEAFSVFTQPVRLELGGAGVSFRPDRTGNASSEKSSWRVLNPDQFGVVYGGMMEFEVVANGAAWLTELQKLGVDASSTFPAKIEVPLVLHIGNARHTIKAELTCRSR